MRIRERQQRMTGSGWDKICAEFSPHVGLAFSRGHPENLSLRVDARAHALLIWVYWKSIAQLSSRRI